MISVMILKEDHVHQKTRDNVMGEGQSDVVMFFKIKITSYRTTQQLLLNLMAHNCIVGLSFLNCDHRGTLY